MKFMLCGANVPVNVKSGMERGVHLRRIKKAQCTAILVCGMPSLWATDRLGINGNRGERDILLSIDCAFVFLFIDRAFVFIGSAEDLRRLVLPVVGESTGLPRFRRRRFRAVEADGVAFSWFRRRRGFLS